MSVLPREPTVAPKVATSTPSAELSAALRTRGHRASNSAAQKIGKLTFFPLEAMPSYINLLSLEPWWLKFEDAWR